jgi:hypothetical protein
VTLPEPLFLTGEEWEALSTEEQRALWRNSRATRAERLEKILEARRWREANPILGAEFAPLDRSARCTPSCGIHNQHVYILCFGSPRVIRDRDYRPSEPRPVTNYALLHYVGWTGQHPPSKRVRDHGGKYLFPYIVEIRPGTPRDEFRIKCEETCARCGESLWYYRVPRETAG